MSCVVLEGNLYGLHAELWQYSKWVWAPVIFELITLERYECSYPLPNYGLNSSTIVLLEGWLWHWITYEVWCPIKQRNKTKLGLSLDFCFVVPLWYFFSWQLYPPCHFIPLFITRGVMVIVIGNGTWRHKFKSWTKLITFHIALISLEKVWIQLFSLQLWVNSRAD